MQHYGGAVWLTHMKHLSVPFYQAYDDETMETARCADLLLGRSYRQSRFKAIFSISLSLILVPQPQPTSFLALHLS